MNLSMSASPALRFAAATLLLSALVLAPSSASPAPAPATADSIPRAMRERVVRDLHTLIQDRFAHWDGVPEFRFPARFEAYRTHALATPGRREFSLLTRAFVASLRNGHTTYSDTWTLAVDPAQLPFTLGWIDGEWIVLASRQAGLATGDVVTRIDDRPVESMYRSIEPYLCASNDRARRRQFTARGFLWPERFQLGTSDGRTMAISRSPGPAPKTEPVVTDRWLVPDSVGYIAIRSFGESEHEARALELVRKRYLEAHALIVDVRGNGGGNTPRTLIKTLLDGRPYTWWKEDPNRLPMSALDRMGAAMRRAGSVRPTYRGTLILLVDGDCASACEDFVMPLVWEHRAIAVGDTTCGSTGQPVFASFDNGITVSVSAKRAHFPDGSPFEGVGIAPTLRVPRSRADIVSGADRALETALQLARRPAPASGGR